MRGRHLLELSGSHLVKKTRMSGLQSGDDKMMINSVVWAQYINVTDTKTDSHIAIANAAPTHCVGWQKII